MSVVLNIFSIVTCLAFAYAAVATVRSHRFNIITQCLIVSVCFLVIVWTVFTFFVPLLSGVRIEVQLPLMISAFVPPLLLHIAATAASTPSRRVRRLVVIAYIIGVCGAGSMVLFEDTSIPQAQQTGTGAYATLMYRSEDGGKSWEKMQEQRAEGPHIGSVVFSRSNPDHLFVLPFFRDPPAENEKPRTVLERGPGLWRVDLQKGKIRGAARRKGGIRTGNAGDIAIHPENPRVIYAAVDCQLNEKTDIYIHGPSYEHAASPSGIYKSSDGGTHWRQVYSFARNAYAETVSAIHVSPADPDLIYAGNANRIIRSEDGGASWETVCGGESGWIPRGWIPREPVSISTDPADAGHVFAATCGNGILESRDGGFSWGPVGGRFPYSHIGRVAASPWSPQRMYAAGSSGIWEYRANGAWQGLHEGLPQGRIVPDGYSTCTVCVQEGREYLVAAPAGSVALIGKYPRGEYSRGEYSGHGEWEQLWSLERDPKGAPTEYAAADDPGSAPTEPAAADDFGELEISVLETAPSNPEVLYAAIANRGLVSKHEPPRSGAGMLVSRDGGRSWNYVADAAHRSAVMDIAIHPDDAGSCLVTTGKGVFRVSDFCSSWQRIETLPDDGSVRVIAYDPRRPRHIVAGIDNEGFSVTRDGGESWRSAVDHYPLPEALSDLCFDRYRPGYLYAADYRYGISYSPDGGRSWRRMGRNSGSLVPTDLHMSSEGRFLYCATDGKGVFRAELKTLSDTMAGGNGGGAIWESAGGPPGGIVHCLIHHPQKPGSMYACEQRIGILVKAGEEENWESRDPPALSVLTISAHDPDTLWAGKYWGGEVYKSYDGGNTWEKIPLSMDMREGEVVIRDIAVSPFDSDTVVVVAEGLLEKPVTSPLRFSWVYAGYLAALAIFAGIVLQQETLPGYGILVWSQSGRLGKQKKPYTDTSFIENIQQPVIIIDREYHIRALNEQAIQLFGRSREELTDQTLSAVISEQGGNIDALSEGTDSLQGSGSFPVLCKKGDGELFDCLLTFSSVTNEAGGEVGYMIALTDSQWLVHIAEEYGLTPRETEIASLLIKGEKYTDMAEALHISEATLKTHIHHIYEKVGVRNRLQLIEIAREGFLRR